MHIQCWIYGHIGKNITQDENQGNTAVSQSMHPHPVQMQVQYIKHAAFWEMGGQVLISRVPHIHSHEVAIIITPQITTFEHGFLLLELQNVILILQRRTINRSDKYFFNWLIILILGNSLAESAILSTRKWENRPLVVYAVKAQTSLAPLSRFHGSRITTAHAHQCFIFQSYAKTVPSQMKLTMREPASMTMDT